LRVSGWRWFRAGRSERADGLVTAYADLARSVSGTSSGSGLAIVRTILELHRRFTTVESKPNATTTFRLYSPLT
jgi:signal transduction histidine kinase